MDAEFMPLWPHRISHLKPYCVNFPNMAWGWYPHAVGAMSAISGSDTPCLLYIAWQDIKFVSIHLMCLWQDRSDRSDNVSFSWFEGGCRRWGKGGLPQSTSSETHHATHIHWVSKNIDREPTSAFLSLFSPCSQDLGNSCQMPDPKIPKSGHFCLHGFSKILSTLLIRPCFCTKFVHTLDQALIGSVQNFLLC